MIIADTNVVSEFMKDAPNTAVLRWAQGIRRADLTITVITVEEVERGLGRMPAGRRRRDLEQRWDGLLRRFTDSITSYDLAAAHATAGVLVESLRRGHQMTLADAQIAGICRSLGATLATRNTKDFEDIAELDIVDPFDAPPT
ncbi:hypothetical protein BJY21_002424 [Kineosphaera limosa]|uniref:Ribonuclease VapC n=1 Tax=Kineosphaera limosa NBRC 100340 TaxID=1184609 RepID=K6XCL4_9MICO|nr:type II toxin-antitoxin system VapC family toxin [Kineosphaera limosa]NYE01240.1 hypothetical protein [Kineosphaera limosa]GAB96559.1 hypothetical protein KILIM_042_00030 [Kineosphaera limosa NBRC 100340]